MRMQLPITLTLALVFAMPATTLSAAQFVHPASFRAISNDELREFVNHLQSTSNDFDDDFTDALDDTLLDGTDEEDRLQNQAEALEDTFDKMRDAFKNGGSDAEVRDLAARALTIAADINRVILKHHFKYEVEGDWDHIRRDLNGVAEYFGLPALPSHPQ